MTPITYCTDQKISMLLIAEGMDLVTRFSGKRTGMR